MRRNIAVNKFFSTSKRVWHEEELYRYMKQKGLLEIGENEKMIMIEIWNTAIETIWLEDYDEQVI